MKKTAAGVLALTLSVALAASSQATAPATGYRYKHFYCTHDKTHASVKMWEAGTTGVMQFEAIFIAQKYYKGSWHNIDKQAFSSRVFRDTAGSHYYGYIAKAFKWSTQRSHREAVRMLWWHRHPNRVVQHATLFTRACG